MNESLLQFIKNLFPFIVFFYGYNLTFSKVLSSVFIIVIFLVAFIFGIKLWWEYKKIVGNIKSLITFLSQYDNKNIINNFEKVNEKLTQDKLIGHFWSEFTETLIIQRDEENNVLFNSKDPRNFFNEDNLIFSNLNIHIYKAIPSVLTGLGILGTFLGLTLGLSQINLGSSDINVLKNGIKGLLSGASMAFSTSVWGIGCSLVFLIFKRWNLSKLNNLISKFIKEIDRLFTRKTPENFLYEIVKEMKEQTLQLKTFNDDLAISIAEALDEKLATRLTPTFEKLIIAIEELTKTGSSELAKTITERAGDEILKLKDVLNEVGTNLLNTVAISEKNQQRLVENFDNFIKQTKKQHLEFNNNIQNSIEHLTKNINSILSDHSVQIKELNQKAFEEITNWVGKASEEIKDLIGKLNNDLDSIINKMNIQTQKLGDLLENAIKDLVQNYQTEQKNLKALLEGLQLNITNMQTLIREAGMTAKTFGRHLEIIKEINITLHESLEKIKQTSKSVESSVYEFRILSEQYIKSLETITSTLLESFKKTENAWKVYEDKFSGLREDLEKIFEEIEEGLKSYIQLTRNGLDKALRKFDENLAETIRYLQSIMSGIKEIQEELIDHVETLIKRKS